jgi:hypothetical protein
MWSSLSCSVGGVSAAAFARFNAWKGSSGFQDETRGNSLGFCPVKEGMEGCEVGDVGLCTSETAGTGDLFAGIDVSDDDDALAIAEFPRFGYGQRPPVDFRPFFLGKSIGLEIDFSGRWTSGEQFDV